MILLKLLCGHPANRLHYGSGPSVPYGLITRKQKGAKKQNWSSYWCVNFQLRVSGLRLELEMQRAVHEYIRRTAA